jgi:hypothetical protein
MFEIALKIEFVCRKSFLGKKRKEKNIFKLLPEHSFGLFLLG